MEAGRGTVGLCGPQSWTSERKPPDCFRRKGSRKEGKTPVNGSLSHGQRGGGGAPLVSAPAVRRAPRGWAGAALPTCAALGPNEPHPPVSVPPQPISSLPSSSTTPGSCWPPATRVAGSSSSSGNRRCGGAWREGAYTQPGLLPAGGLSASRRDAWAG